MSENHDDGRRRFLGYAALVALAPLAANQAVAQTKALPKLPLDNAQAKSLGYVEKAADLKAQGIDEIACTAVNDPFVMGAWSKAAGSSDVTMLADGNGDFAEALGLTMDGSGFGLGKRGQRFSMVVNDGVVEQLHVEGPGEFKVSSAEYMLDQL